MITLVGTVAIMLCVTAVLGGAASEREHVLEHGVQTTGVTTGKYRQEFVRHGPDNYYREFEYIVDGVRLTVLDHHGLSDTQTIRKGDEWVVFYLPDDPSRAQVR